MKRKDEYIDNVEFEREIEAFRELGRPASCRLGQLVTEMHLGVLRSVTFRDYPAAIKQEMMEYSIHQILKTRFRTWDRSKGSRAFSYYSRAVIQNYMLFLKQRARRLYKEQHWKKEWEEIRKEFSLLLV